MADNDNDAPDMSDEDVVYEEEVEHEEELDPEQGGEIDLADLDPNSYVIDEGTAGQPIYDNEEMGEGGEEEDGPDDSVMGFLEHTDSVYCIGENPIHPVMITGGGDDRAFVWDWQTGEKKSELTGFKESVVAVGFSSDGKWVAAGDLNGEVRAWDTTTKKLNMLDGPGEAIEWMDWHSKGNILLAGSADGCVYMWTAATAAMMGVFAGHSGSVTCGRFTPDGKKVVTGSEDGTARVWNPKDQQSLFTFSGHLWHSLPLTCLKVKNDSSIFITGSEDTCVCVGNITTGRPVTKLVGHTGSVESVGFSNQIANFAYSGSMDGTLRIWDLNSSQCRSTCTHEEGGEDHGVTQLLELDGLVATGNVDGVVRLWDERTGQNVRKFLGHKDVILDMVLTNDKSAIVTTSDDRTCRVFSLRS